MKAIKLNQPWSVECVEMEKPVPGPGEALVRIVAAGICGSDIGAFRGANQLVSYPRVIGHELAGVIESIPADNPKHLRPGDRVVLDPYLTCGHCFPCRNGHGSCCTSLKVLGVQTEGGMAEYFCHPADLLYPIPDGMPWESAAMAEPLAVSVHEVHSGDVKPGEFCLIYGAGPIGMLAGMAAKAFGARVIMADVVQERLDLARQVGIDVIINSAKEDVVSRVAELTGGDMAPLVMECTGADACIRESLDTVAPSGRITFTGWPKHEILLPTDKITKKEIRVCGSRVGVGNIEEALELIRSGRVDVARLLTKTISMEEAPAEVIDIERNPAASLKVIVRMAEE